MTKTNNEEKRWPQELFFQECVWCGEKTNIDFVQEKFQEVAEHTRQALLSHLISKVEGMKKYVPPISELGETLDVLQTQLVAVSDEGYNLAIEETLSLLRE